MSGTSNSIPRVNSQFQPIQLKGHERAITVVKYNLDGDLLFTASKDKTPTIWYSDTGDRIGTYGSHQGAVWDLDPSWDSEYLLTACADANARLFEATTGKYIARMPQKGVVRCVKWGDSNNLFATASDAFTSRETSTISIFTFPTPDVLQVPVQSATDTASLHSTKFVIEVDDGDKCTSLGWTIADQHLIAAFDSGRMIKYDVTTGQEVLRKDIHTDRINRANFNRDKSMLITASKDCSAKLMEPNNLEVIYTYRTDKPVNGAVISPTHPHVILGGGQDAQSVAVTGSSHGRFETRFFHMLYGDEFARVKGHFGPINALDIHPFGKSFASGSEDGFIRLHHFDSNYITMPTYLPDGFEWK